jgi:hypothetical protein
MSNNKEVTTELKAIPQQEFQKCLRLAKLLKGSIKRIVFLDFIHRLVSQY